MDGVSRLLAVPAVLVALCAVASGQGAGGPAVARQPIRVAVYADRGSPRTPRDMQRVLGDEPAYFAVRYLSAADIEAGGLREFDVLVQGGGDSRVQSRELSEKGRDAIRSFVHEGGGYVGICAGAHFAVPGDKLKLGILNARVVDNEHWARGRGDVVLSFTQAGESELRQPARTKVMYHQGPLLMPGDRTDLPAYTPLASYETEVAKNGAPHGVMKGTDAVVSAPYGAGRVIVFSPHPEQTPGQEGMVRQAVLWASRRADAASTTPKSAVPTAPASSERVALPAARVESSELPAPVEHVPQDSGCCGPITPEGMLLVKYLDSLDVDHLWPQHVYVDWRTGQPAPRNGHHEPKTHCSAFAAAAAMRLNIYMMRPPEHSQSELAAAQERYFRSARGWKDGWVSVSTPQQAQAMANQGEFVVLVYGDPNPHKSGHIAIVRPAVKSMAALNDEGPQTTQAGGHNFSSGTAKYSFTFHKNAWPNKVMMFAHKIDFRLPQQKPSTDAGAVDKASDDDQ